MLKNLFIWTNSAILALTMLAWPILAQAQNPSPLVVIGEAVAADSNVAQGSFASPQAKPVRRANFLEETPSADARRVADWVAASGDNNGLPFIVVDKIRAKVFVFDRNGWLLGATSALLGEARGDDSVPGIGGQTLSSITPAERTTPAGRFVAEPGRDLHNDVLWIDYGASLALHRVIAGPGDRRLHRLETKSASDKRISYGCVEVPTEFYDDVVQKTFMSTGGIVYILPEIKTVQDVFPKASGVDRAVSIAVPNALGNAVWKQS
jgi:hypothetical protein